MKKTIEVIVEHPIATTIVIGSIARSIATIIYAVKGKPIAPVVTINKGADEIGASVGV